MNKDLRLLKVYLEGFKSATKDGLKEAYDSKLEQVAHDLGWQHSLEGVKLGAYSDKDLLDLIKE